MGKPVALKVISPEVSHKSDQGGVLLNIAIPPEAEKAFEKTQKGRREKFSGVLSRR